jgi:hypothetical protein
MSFVIICGAGGCGIEKKREYRRGESPPASAPAFSGMAESCLLVDMGRINFCHTFVKTTRKEWVNSLRDVLLRDAL